jgi:hypothetical protein
MKNKRFSAQAYGSLEQKVATRYVFIVHNTVCSFEFDDALEDKLFKLEDKRFYDIAVLKSLKTLEDMNQLFHAATKDILSSGRNTVLLGANPAILLGLHGLGNLLEEENGHQWLFFTFFHSDDDTALLDPLPLDPDETEAPGAAPAETILEQKMKCLLAMTYMPFVKKVEIPLDTVITEKYLQELFEQYGA